MPAAKRHIGKSKPKRLGNAYFQLKITLVDAPLPIWRRVVISSDTRLAIVHEIFQIVMGWWNVHLHDFEVDGRHFGDIETADGDPKVEDDTAFTLADIVNKPGDRFTYHYDFGDSWRHEVVIEEIIPSREGKILAACICGRRACPPDDVGGTSGYREFLEIIEDPQHEERIERLEWVGGDFDPDSYDLRGVNLRLIQLQSALEELDELALAAKDR